MTGIKQILTILFVVVITTSAFSQGSGSSVSLFPWQLKNFAKSAVRMGDIYSAIDYMEAYSQIKPENLEVSYKLAELYRKSRDYKKAEEWYLKAFKGNEKKYIDALYWNGVMQKMNGKYEDAKETLSKFRRTCKGMKDEKLYKKMAKVEIEGCEIAAYLMDSTLKVLVTHLDSSVNKPHIDFAPVSLDENTLMYASLKEDKVNYYIPDDTINRMPVRKFYTAKRSGQTWKGTGEWDEGFNDPLFNHGNGAFSIDGNKFYFTRSEKNWQNVVISSIYVSEKVNGKWTEPVKMPEPLNNPKYTTTMPTMGTESNKGMEVLYFVSDRPGGKGGLDIWFAIWDKKTGGFKDPKNAGSVVNTYGDEIAPFYDMETRKLFFSSNGMPGLGGQDIYKTTGELRHWTPPRNQGYPINSSADDIYFIISKDRERGFFASNREGGFALTNPTCCDDIYEYRWTEFIHIAIDGFVFEKVNPEMEDTLLAYIESIGDSAALDSLGLFDEYKAMKELEVVDTKSGEKRRLLNNSRVNLFLVEKENGVEESFFVKSVPVMEEGADFLVPLEQGNDYKLVAECDGYFNNQAYFTTKDIITSDTLHQPIELRKIPLEAIVLENIYYEFDKADLTPEAMQTLDTTLLVVMKDNPKIIVELSSHTDSKGNDDYNQKLSQKRAESVVKYLINNGIDELRLIAKGYGETLPVAANENPDGSDNPEGRQKNRRTEFRVIGSSDQFSKLNQGGLMIKKQEPDKVIQQED